MREGKFRRASIAETGFEIEYGEGSDKLLEYGR
jgi:hypothetical protein